jgi:hypothetical protein
MTPLHFYIFVIISPLKKTWPFIWTNLNLLHPRIICSKFNWILPAGFGEQGLKKYSVYIYSFAIISPSRRVIPFIWTKLNPLHPRIICIKFDWIRPSGFLTRRFLKILSVFSLLYLPLEKGYSLCLKKLEFPSLKYILY